MTEEIKELTKHLKDHKHDFSSRKGLLKKVNAELDALDATNWASVKLAVYYWLAIIENIDRYKAFRN